MKLKLNLIPNIIINQLSSDDNEKLLKSYKGLSGVYREMSVIFYLFTVIYLFAIIRYFITPMITSELFQLKMLLTTIVFCLLYLSYLKIKGNSLSARFEEHNLLVIEITNKIYPSAEIKSFEG